MIRELSRFSIIRWLAVVVWLVCVCSQPTAGDAQATGTLRHQGEVHLSDLRQLTFDGENAEAYWSPDGTELILQSTHGGLQCDQIFRLPVARPEAMRQISDGRGRTTCSYFTPDASRVLFSSTRSRGADCPPPPDRTHGYVWAVYPSYEIYTAAPDGSDLTRLTDNDAYDAEATVCPLDGSIIFTSDRDGDLELYRMRADGSDVRRLTHTPGYDGGAFFSPDCKQIVWRASRPQPGSELQDYESLLARHLVRPGRLEIWIANADGTNARQITYLGAASFAPYFFPDGRRVIFSSNYGDPQGREFDLWAVNANGTGLERITWAPGFDGFPMFSPDGHWLAFSSNRHQGAPGETDVYVARWGEAPSPQSNDAADRFLADVAWLADDAREGRGIGTRGLDEATEWLAEQFRQIGLEPVGSGGYRQPFEVPVEVVQRPETGMEVDGQPLPPESFQVAAFSAEGTVAAPIVFAGYGVTAPDLHVDDYAGLDVRGKVVLVRRFLPEDGPYADDAARRRFSDLHSKAINAREHGAVAVLFSDLPEAAAGGELPEEAPFPPLRVDTGGDSGLPVFFVKRATAEALITGKHATQLRAALERRSAETANVIGMLDGALPGDTLVLIGAHYDHLGYGGPGSFEPDSHAIHNGADDNASGTAALLEAARWLEAHRDELAGRVLFVAFSGEEEGVLGSSWFTRHPPAGIQLSRATAMINMDMVGRLRDDRLQVLGAESAAEWTSIVSPLCNRLDLRCALGGDGYGPSDQTPFFADGVPVLHLFSGTHDDYHRPSDDVDKINAAGGAQVAHLAAALAQSLGRRGTGLTYQQASAPAPPGDVRSYGASLGSVPDYGGPGEGKKGLLLAGVRPGGPADLAGMKRGDIIVELAGHPIGDIYDLMYVLQQAKPGQHVTAVVERGEERLRLRVVFGERHDRR